MAETLTSAAVLGKLSLPENEQTAREFSLSGTVPASVSSSDVKKTLTILGITPDDFSKEYASAEFDYELLKKTFTEYCKDFNDDLKDETPSKALEFSSKMLFELGPYIRSEKKTKGDKAIKFKFPYVKTDGPDRMLTIRVVIVSTFKDSIYSKMEDGKKMILTFKQAGLLAMEVFMKAIKYCYNKESSHVMLMTPLCGAVFARDSISSMAREMNVDEITVLTTINASTTAGGQHLLESDLSCAIAAMISVTKRVADKNIRSSMITRLIKQYSGKHKIYKSENFQVYAKYALGGVPAGMDADTLIENFSNIQIAEVSARAKAAAIKMTEQTTSTSVPSYDKGTGSTSPPPRVAKK